LIFLSLKETRWQPRFWIQRCFRDCFGTPRMRAIFEDRALLARYVEAEVALARAQGRCGG